MRVVNASVDNCDGDAGRSSGDFPRCMSTNCIKVPGDSIRGTPAKARVVGGHRKREGCLSVALGFDALCRRADPGDASGYEKCS